MIFTRIEFGSDDFRKECALRHQELRAPIGLNLYDEDLAPEQHQWHFGLFDEARQLIACVIAVHVSPTEAKIRQMAVDCAHQQHGYGREIMRGLEQHLAKEGIHQIFMHARTSAVGFYNKLGYTQTGPEFIEVGIPHFRMEKKIESISS